LARLPDLTGGDAPPTVRSSHDMKVLQLEWSCGDYRPSSRMSSHDIADSHVAKILASMKAYEVQIEETKQDEERRCARKAGRFEAS
jgi:hypothetical protein